jgi:hypothetical protein
MPTRRAVMAHSAVVPAALESFVSWSEPGMAFLNSELLARDLLVLRIEVVQHRVANRRP